MTFIFAPHARAERDELIDSEEPSEADFAASFRDIARVNRYLGGTQAVLKPLTAILRSLPPEYTTVRILDIATGSADIPRAIAHAARQGRFGPGRTVEIIATDNHSKVLAFARQQTPSASYPEIRVEPADAFALSYADASFDITLCSMAFHHFGPQQCIVLLREMQRVSRMGFIVNDLIRDWIACGLIWALTRLVGANRLTRHDAPLSVLRAYTRGEFADMAHEAGIPNYRVQLAPMYRAVLVSNTSPDTGKR
jgi:ubiquinone/menaquinone biosynthesis C-methylase UbiE